MTDIHHCHIKWHDVSTEERMELLCKALNREYETKPYDTILSLGDYSLDFWAWDVGGSYLWETPVSNTEDFVKRFVPQMPTDFYMIAGNHEQYGEKTWRSITGMPREYVVLYRDYVFVMLDTFAGELAPKVNHDGCYTGINVEFLTQVIEDHKGKKVILCAHDLCVACESEQVRTVVFENDCIICAFAGHTHLDNTLILPNSWRNLPIFYCGDFSYNAGRLKEKNWGYRVLELSGETLSTEYVKL